MAARNKAWKDANSETVKATAKAYRATVDRAAQAAYQRAYRAANIEKRLNWERERRKRSREHLLAYRADWREKNRQHLRQQERERRARNLERIRATDRLWSQLRRARERNALITPFTKADVDARMAYWGNRCYVCGAPWEAIDHVKPLSKGGAHCLSNFRPICAEHNGRKLDRWHGVAWAHGLTGAGDVT